MTRPRQFSLEGLPWPRPGKHTRIARLNDAHLDELLRRRIARQDRTARQHPERIDQERRL